MNTLLSYCGLVDVRISASDKDLPVQNGDPSLERTTIVNQNLNDAVSCYRNRIILIDPKFVDTKVLKEDAVSDDLPDDLNDFFEKVDNSDYGGFQLEFVSISRVINHMACYKFECSQWWKIYLKKNPL